MPTVVIDFSPRGEPLPVLPLTPVASPFPRGDAMMGCSGLIRVRAGALLALAAAALLSAGWQWPPSRSATDSLHNAVSVKLLIWPKRAGTPTGASMDVSVDGTTRGSISNLDEQMVLDLGNLEPGIHQYQLTNIGMYMVDNDGGTDRRNDGNGKCAGQFYVQPFQTYYVLGVFTQDGIGFQCNVQ